MKRWPLSLKLGLSFQRATIRHKLLLTVLCEHFRNFFCKTQPISPAGRLMKSLKAESYGVVSVCVWGGKGGEGVDGFLLHTPFKTHTMPLP